MGGIVNRRQVKLLANEAVVREDTPDLAAAPRILCVDDEPGLLAILARALGTRFDVVTINDPVAALSLLERRHGFSVVISDIKMPQMDGATFLAQVKHIAPMSTRLALTACLERELSPDQVFGVLTKPCPLNILHESVSAAVQHHATLTGASGVLPRIAPLLEDSSHQEARTSTLSMLAAVAEKFFLRGQSADAERILQPPLEDLARSCQSGRLPCPKDSEVAIHLAARLAAETRAPRWIDYIFRVVTALRRPLDASIVALLHELMRQVPGTSLTGFRAYVDVLRASQDRFNPAQQFMVRRIEGLEPLMLI